MNDSDREFLSRFTVDPPIESGFEDLYGSYFSDDDDEMNPLDDENLPDSDDLNLEDDFLFEN